MFKIKVGLKSFQTHSMLKCKQQIGRIVSSLKTSSPSHDKGDVFLTKKSGNKRTPFKKGHTTTVSPLSKGGSLHPSANRGGRLLALHSQRALFPKEKTQKGDAVFSNKVVSQVSQKNNKVETLFETIPLPTLVKKMTTLRSPHIDKKSREQFEWKREKAQISFDLESAPQISLILFILRHSRFPGVEIEIGVESKTYLA